MRLLLGGFLVWLRTQAGHVRVFAEFGCLRRLVPRLRQVARTTAHPCFQLSSSMHSAEGFEGSRQGGCNGSRWTRVGNCKVRCDRLKSKCFSQNIDSGVSILSAQTDVQHCASTVVAICTKYGWTMWRVFLGHLGTQFVQFVHANKIAEGGFL